MAGGGDPEAIMGGASRLYVTSATTDTISVIDIATQKKVNTLTDAPPAGPQEGSTPNALAISRDGKRLFVAEADNNAVAVFDPGTGKLLGPVPPSGYPTALARLRATAFVPRH